MIELAKGWSGAHAFTVTATGRPGLSAQAAIRIDGSVGLLQAFESSRRVRIYGIHFDVDSAKIQPLSEVTIAQIAQVLGAHPGWKMRVEGHTDSDGGAPYNKTLSVRRAEAVVADLVTRYHVARARLTSAGFGLTHPVASNATEAGKALNRRVELVRL
jgi:outer membrane protein OmpA-like peptidoglycan-associated protein